MNIRIPPSTYRLQLHRGFTVEDVLRLVPYFRDLGIGALYISPILKARAGSLHGYDAVDPDELNPELGTPADFRRLGKALADCGMTMIVDIVPNHMCIADSANWRWMDVLENGPSSPCARYFDVDWHPPREGLQGKVLIPVLGEQYGRVLENGDLRLEYHDGVFRVRYADKVFPLAVRTWWRILDPLAAELRSRLGEEDGWVMEIESIITALSHLPFRTETDEERLREGQREREVIRSRLTRLMEESRECRSLLPECLCRLNGRKGEPESFDELEKLLADQAYRLSYWRVASDEINYRRFFDINELASIRVEDPSVFEAVHARILDGVREGWIAGLRVDHPDGLYDPARYFEDLQAAALQAMGVSESTSNERSLPPFYVVAEKIMGNDERPRRDWAVHGTTGYGFLNELNGLFVDPGAKDAINGVYERFTGRRQPFADLVYECKLLILRDSLSSELNVLARRLDRICQQHRHTRDFTLQSLRSALTEVIACFPVYRTYVSETQLEVDGEDRRQILLAIDAARQRNPAMSASVFSAIASMLLLEDPPGLLSGRQKAERRLFVMRFQQLTGPVMAKGVEDTAFYRQFPLLSLNEVGGDPETFGLEVKEFHRGVLRRAELWPHNLLSSSTHDTKRSEDVRARINVLSEIPEEWASVLRRWSVANEPFRTTVDGSLTPDRRAEYLLYQTLAGLWPLEGFPDAEAREAFAGRVQAYMEKSLYEAKLKTSWVNPNIAYDSAIRDFVAAVLRESPDNAFAPDIEAFARSIGEAGLWNGLSQAVLKMTCPGVPDIYQGSELWNFSLVDPDNRRPVDFALRGKMLAELPLEASELRTPQDLLNGRLKLFVTATIARYRRENREFFERAAYAPLEATGASSDHVVSFARRLGERCVVVAVGRFFVKLGCRARIPIGEDVWGDGQVGMSDLPGGTYRDLLSGNEVVAENGLLSVAQAFARLPVAVLVGDIGALLRPRHQPPS